MTVFCPTVQYLLFYCEAFSERSWRVVAFPCFTVVKSFTSWYALLLRSSSDFLQSRYNVLLSSFLLPFSCCCSLPCISQILQVILQLIFSFSVLSFCRTDQEFLQ